MRSSYQLSVAALLKQRCRSFGATLGQQGV
jgi:hypothetical protein